MIDHTLVQQFRDAWHDAQGDDFASKMQRQSLEVSATQVPELDNALFELKYGHQTQLSLRLSGPEVIGHSTNAERFAELVRGIIDAVKEITKVSAGRQRMKSGLLISALAPGSVQVTMQALAPEEVDGAIKEARTATEDSNSLRIVATILARTETDDGEGGLDVLAGLVKSLPSKARPGIRRAATAISHAKWDVEGELREASGERFALRLNREGAESLVTILDEKDVESGEVSHTGYVDGQRRSLGAMWFVPDHSAPIEAAVLDPHLLDKVASLAAEERRVVTHFSVVKRYPKGSPTAARNSYILTSIEPAVEPSGESAPMF